MTEIETRNFDSYLHQAKVQEYFLIKNHWRAIERAMTRGITDQIDETYKYSPEYIIIENERKAIIEHFWLEFKERVNPIDFAYFMKYISCQNNALASSKELQKQQIKELGLTEKIFRKRIKNCQKIAFKLLEELKISIDDFKQFLAPTITDYFVGAVKQTGYPFEHFMNLPEKKEWQDKFGTKMAVTKKTCLIPEYLKDCGLCDCQCIICADTNNCRRKDVYPSNDNTKALKAHEEKIAKIAEKLAAYTATRDIKDYEREYLS